MLNQLRNNIIRKNNKVIRREVKRRIQEMRFRDKLKWLLGKGTLGAP